MADESENPALAMLIQLEARLEGLVNELLAVRSRLVFAEARLARLEADREALAAPDSLMQQAIEHVLDITALAPPLSAREDEDALAEVMQQIKARRSGVLVLSEDERAALVEAWRNGIATQEEVAAFLKRRGIEDES